MDTTVQVFVEFCLVTLCRSLPGRSIPFLQQGSLSTTTTVGIRTAKVVAAGAEEEEEEEEKVLAGGGGRRGDRQGGSSLFLLTESQVKHQQRMMARTNVTHSLCQVLKKIITI